MCRLCASGYPQQHGGARSKFSLLAAGAAVTAGAAFALGTRLARPAAAQLLVPPRRTGQPGRRYLIRGGTVLSMDPAVGDFATADVLVEGKKILAVGVNLAAGDADVVEAAGRLVMPGFIDTHHHQFETALRSFLPNGLLVNDGQPHGAVNYMEYVLGRFSPVYQPQDVYIAELFGALSQLDAGVTTVHDLSQTHHSPAHTEAALRAITEAGQRTAFSYSESQANPHFADEARRLQQQYFSSKDQLLTLVIGGEVYAPNYREVWQLARGLGLPIACHVLGPMMPGVFESIAKDGMLGPDNLLIHMTGIDDESWKITAGSGAGISLSVPIEMAMGHGTPPILEALGLGLEPSLSSDVECTMAADMFTQMRGVFTQQRMLAHEAATHGAGRGPALLTARDVVRFATVHGAQDLWLGDKTGSLTPGKEADIILLDATALNVAPLNNAPGAVVTLMDRSNVETVIVAGKIRKWQGRLLDADVARLGADLTASRDRLFAAAGIAPNLFGD